MLDNYFSTSVWLTLPSKLNTNNELLCSTVNYDFANTNSNSSDEEMESASPEMEVEAACRQPTSDELFSQGNQMHVEINTQNYNANLQSFINSIKQAKNHILQGELATLISQEALTNIYDFFLNSQAVLNSMNNMSANNSAYLAKEATGLARTLSLIRSKNNEYKLILETKSKLANGTKHEVETQSGAKKKGKTAWRIDTPLRTPYFSLVVKLENENALAEIQNEVACSQHFASDFVNENELGEVHQKNGIAKVNVYSEKAVCDLSKIIDKGIPHDEKKLILSDILQGLKQFHDAGFVFQDLKPQNILVFSKKGKCRAKLTDFGLVKAENSGCALATNRYHSPEIAYLYADPAFSFDGYQYFNGQNYGPYFANLITQAMNNPYQGADRNTFISANKANDMWSLGIVAYELINDGKHPDLNNTDKLIYNSLFSGLLNPNRNERLKIDGAIHEYNKIYAANHSCIKKRPQNKLNFLR